jgi:ribosomal protein S21
MGVRIVVGDQESIQSALKRFKNALARNNVPWEMRRRVEFQDGTEVKRRKLFRKRYKARLATLVGMSGGKQPVVIFEIARAEFCRKTGKR